VNKGPLYSEVKDNERGEITGLKRAKNPMEELRAARAKSEKGELRSKRRKLPVGQ